MGCCFAVSREVYEKLGGFDLEMRGWGSEQVDFGLKLWLLGYRVLNDIEAVVGHRFQPDEACDVSKTQIVANQLRTARKHFTEATWSDWLGPFRVQHPNPVWKEAWEIFAQRGPVAERERDDLMARRVHDEFWYADEFDLGWPARLAERPSFDRWLETENGSSRPPLNDPNAIGTARAGNGTWVTFLLKIGRRLWGPLDVERVSFQCHGPHEILACAACLARMIEGRSLEEVGSLEAGDLLRRFAQQAEGAQAATLALEALGNALSKFENPPRRSRIVSAR